MQILMLMEMEMLMEMLTLIRIPILMEITRNLKSLKSDLSKMQAANMYCQRMILESEYLNVAKQLNGYQQSTDAQRLR
jgi:hypothetical protein